MIGNGPIGFWPYPNKTYSYNPVSPKHELAKVFYFRVVYLFGGVKLNQKNNLEDFAWVTKDELQTYFPNAEYYSYIRSILDD